MESSMLVFHFSFFLLTSLDGSLSCIATAVMHLSVTLGKSGKLYLGKLVDCCFISYLVIKGADLEDG